MARKRIAPTTRFEVFKRDGFCCQYCGRKPPEVVLELDHIEPVSAGGDNYEYNLATACFECNRGKGSRSVKSAPAPIAERQLQMAEAESQLAEYRKWLRKKESRIARDCKAVDDLFFQLTESHFSKTFLRVSLRRFLRSLTVDEVSDLLANSCSRIGLEPERVVRYFCGCCWKKIKEGVRQP